ncbi:ABC transporter ATP-binding protein [Clostridia bacterium OttesenSCG-928-O13]|nr:ABC transporter ATP-binding protein [Clostridia bacterium OttesenSCG-928-O13]
MTLDFQDIHVTLGRSEILKGASVAAAGGNITGIVGANGCGKSTLVRSLFGIVPLQGGRIMLNGKDTKTITRKQIAAQVGYVSQESLGVFDFTVRDVVEMGLFAQGGRRRDGKALVQRAMEELNIAHFADRSILTLSGGERKMAFLARSVAQGVDVLVLDEPTNHLDIRHQLFIMNYLRHSGKTALVVLHDLALATHYCDKVFVMADGMCLASGPPENTLTEATIQKAFGVHGKAARAADGKLEFQLDMDAQEV